MAPAAEVRPQRRPWRMRTRLTLALLAFIVPLTMLLILSHVENLSERRKSRVESFETVGQTIAAVVDGFARDLETLTLSASITLGDNETDPALLNAPSSSAWLNHIVESSGILRAVFVTDLDGRVIASNGGDASSIGLDLSGRPYIKALQGGADSVWSGAIAGLQTGQTTLVQGRVYKDSEGRPLGYLIAALYSSKLATRLPQDLPEDANVSLFDHEGLLLYASRDLGPNVPRDISASPVFAQARNGRSVLLESGQSPTDPDKRYGAFVPVARTGWVVGFTRPKSVVDGPVESRFLRDMVITVGILVAGFVVMIGIASRLSKPLSTLAQAASAIAEGRQPMMPVEAADADVRQLESAMAEMSRAVAEREQRLEDQAHVLETLEGVGESLATELDFSKAVAAVTSAALDLTQADLAAFFYREGGPESDPQLLSVAGPNQEFPLVGDGPVVQRVLNGETLHVADLLALPGPRIEREFPGDRAKSVRSLLAIPVVSRDGRVHGGLFVVHSAPSRFTDYHEKLAIGLARRAGVIVENAKLYSAALETEERLRRANVAKDEFVGLMSHELRTPITTIYGGARLLQTRRKHLAEEDVTEMIGSIEEEAERLYRLVENLLALARADLNQQTNREVVSVSQAVDQVTRQFAGRHPSRTIEVNLVKDLPPALAESTYLHQVLHNLISNADKYSDARQPIEVVVDVEEDEVVVRVLDRGPGVDLDELDHIFESFYRSERTAKQATGKGLGLTVCKRLVEAMSGRIWARLRDGGGLEVGFSLPVATEVGPGPWLTASESPATS